MRARRVVMCVDADEDALSRRAFLLETRRRLSVLQATTAKAALAMLRALEPGTVAVLVTEYDLGPNVMGGEDLVIQAQRVDPALSGLITSRHRCVRPWMTGVFFSATTANAELVERVTALAVRRTGPKREPVLSRTARLAAELAVRGLA